MSATTAIDKLRSMLQTARGPLHRADITKVVPANGNQARAIALLKAGGECFTARDPGCPQRVLYWGSAGARDAWLRRKGAAA